MSKNQTMWSSEELKKLQKAIADNKSAKEIAELFPNRTFNSVNVKRKRLQKELNLEGLINKDIDDLVKKDNYSDLEKKYNFSLKQNLEKDKIIKYQNEIFNNNFKIHTIKPTKLAKSEAVPVILCSDTHIEERVSLEKTDGLNEYNLEIAKKRVENVFVNGLRLIKINNKEIEIKDCIFALLGDFISGNIHEELMVNTEVPPMQAIFIAEEWLASGIKYLLDNSDYSFIIPCVVGNHARITKKIYSSTEQEHSLEYAMYKHLALLFKDNKRVKFIIPNSDTCYVNVYNYTLRFAHGHQIKFSNAIGGIHTQVVKWMNIADTIRKADYTFFGHWHQYLLGYNYVSNGSTIGISCYGKNRFRAETPSQSFCLIDRDRGRTVSAPIFLD